MSVGAALIVFLLSLWRNRSKGVAHSLEDLLVKMFSGSVIPVGAYLVLCGLDSRLVGQVSNVGLYLAAAGLALLYTSVNAIRR
jgi:hypothetical protein